MGGFGARLVGAHGALCVGIDPHPGLLAEWGLTDDPDGLERFALTCVDALAGQVAVLKPAVGVLRATRVARYRGAGAGAGGAGGDGHAVAARRQAR